MKEVSMKERIVIAIEDGIVQMVCSNNPDVKVKIVDIDTDYVLLDEREEIYDEIAKDKDLKELDSYEVVVPGQDE